MTFLGFSISRAAWFAHYLKSILNAWPDICQSHNAFAYPAWSPVARMLTRLNTFSAGKTRRLI